MRIGWRQFQIGTHKFSLPFTFALAVTLTHEHQAAFDAHKHKFLGCAECHSLFIYHPVRLTAHLQDAHGIAEDDAIATVNDMYKRFQAARYKKWEGKL